MVNFLLVKDNFQDEKSLKGRAEKKQVSSLLLKEKAAIFVKKIQDSLIVLANEHSVEDVVTVSAIFTWTVPMSPTGAVYPSERQNLLATYRPEAVKPSIATAVA